MSSGIRLEVLAVGIAVSFATSLMPAANAAEKPVSPDELREGLMAALGNSFEFLGGEMGRTKARVGSWAAERFWFARVRPHKSGSFSVSYAVTFDFPPKARKVRRLPEKAVYVIPF